VRPDDKSDQVPSIVGKDEDRSPTIVARGDRWVAGVLLAGAEPIGDGSDPQSGLPLRIRWVRDASEMVLVPGGEFLMGSTDADPDARSDERPQHRVWLDAYYADVYPVTVRQYRVFCQASGRGMPEAPFWGGWLDDHPVVNVSWHDAVAYCEWAGKRLLTEAEWEKAARGVDGRIWPWGNEWDGRAAHCDYQHHCEWSGKTAPVGSHSGGVSPYGCHDLIGNVWEWCADWYGGEYYRRSPERNPQGPPSGSMRVLRGGSWWNNNLYRLRTAYRLSSTPTNRDPYWGFRCAQGLPVESLPR
jgi:formylglycine-generating enzyme required for sulfatase activity